MTHIFDHPWLQGLFGDAETSAIWSSDRQLAHMMTFEAAYTRALGHAGIVTQSTAEAVAQLIEQFQPDLVELRTGTARDGLPVPALVAQLKQAAGKNAKAVHSGATSQDVIDTALALTLKEFNPLLQNRLSGLVDALLHLSKTHGHRPMMGRTRMQAALPISVRQRLSTWRHPLERHQIRLTALRPQIECLQLGGAVGNRAALDPHADQVAANMSEGLGLDNPSNAWHTTRDNLSDYANLLSLISGTLGKMGHDICLMAQQGISEIVLEGGGGSSAMPHKQNPILAELLVTLARFNATQLSGMHHAGIHEQERSGAAWALEWMILPQMAQTTARALNAATEICQQVSDIGASRAG